jgi:hypothetical protein
MMTNYRRLLLPLTLAALLGGYLMLSPVAGAASSSIGDSEEISALLSNARFEAIELRDDSDKMLSFSRSVLPSQNFAGKLTDVKDHVNKAGKLLAKLDQARGTGSSWQQQAIDHITPVLKELAANTEATINHFNDNRMLVHSKELVEYCSVNYELAKELAALVEDFIDYGESQAKFAELQKKVEAR